MPKRLLRPISLALVVTFCLLNFSVPHAQAKIIGTDVVIAEQSNVEQRSYVKEFLAQEEVSKLMTQYGVDPLEVQNRIDSLSNEELAEIAYSIDQLPAGGDGVGSVVGAVVLIFLVLLVTDILGLTHVYPFTRSVR